MNHEANPPESGGQLIPQPHGGALRPFTRGDPRAAAGRAKAVATLREQRALRTARVDDARRLLTDLVAATNRTELGPVAAALAADVVARVATGEVEIRNGAEAAALLRVLIDIARMEPNATSAWGPAVEMSDEDVAARLRQIRQRVVSGLDERANNRK